MVLIIFSMAMPLKFTFLIQTSLLNWRPVYQTAYLIPLFQTQRCSKPKQWSKTEHDFHLQAWPSFGVPYVTEWHAVHTAVQTQKVESFFTPLYQPTSNSYGIYIPISFLSRHLSLAPTVYVLV